MSYTVGDRVLFSSPGTMVRGIIKDVRSDGLLWIAWSDKLYSFLLPTNPHLSPCEE